MIKDDLEETRIKNENIINGWAALKDDLIKAVEQFDRKQVDDTCSNANFAVYNHIRHTLDLMENIEAGREIYQFE